MLNMNSFQHLSLRGAKDAQVDDGGHQFRSVNFDGKKEVYKIEKDVRLFICSLFL